MTAYEDYSLLRHNTFGIDAKCRRFLEYGSVEEAQQVARMLNTASEPLLIIGGGSNLLLTADFAGTVVHSAIKGYETTADDGSVLLRVGSGEVWDEMVARCVANGWYGAENLSLIPGEVGASAVQNIGAYGAEVKDLIASVEAVEIGTGRLCIFSREECQYGYRDSRFKHEWKNKYLITHVVYRLKTDDAQPSTEYGNIRAELDRRGIQTPTAAELREVVIAIREAKLPDPKVTGNAGSFFMNPVVSREKFEALLAQYPQMPHYYIDEQHEKIPAGWMIDQCGWKGKSLGRAGVHDKQALVLVNRGGATGQEIVDLCEAIRNDVRERFGIDIHPEVNII
jgi:UDP-N-acetylmuramate dehydrogenase